VELLLTIPRLKQKAYYSDSFFAPEQQRHVLPGLPTQAFPGILTPAMGRGPHSNLRIYLAGGGSVLNGPNTFKIGPRNLKATCHILNIFGGRWGRRRVRKSNATSKIGNRNN